MIEDNELTEEAVTEAREVIFDKNLRDRMVEHNFKLGKKYFSYDVLQKKLKKLLP